MDRKAVVLRQHPTKASQYVFLCYLCVLLLRFPRCMFRMPTSGPDLVRRVRVQPEAGLGAIAECNSAIRQISNLRYSRIGQALLRSARFGVNSRDVWKC